jgi:hypothetical protein
MADDTDNGAAGLPVAPEGEAGPPSLLSDVEALVADGKTYAEAELAFQKTRLLYASDKVKAAAIFTGIAAVFVVMAIVALVLGAVLALTPLIGALGAAAVVFVTLLVCAAVLVVMAKARIADLIAAFEERDEQA